MDAKKTINFNVTPSQHETISLRAAENGFDDIINYIKVVALNTQTSSLTPTVTLGDETSVCLDFEVSAAQKKKIEANLEASACETMHEYLLFVSMHAVVSAVLEVRSTGNLDSMLARIAASKKQ